MKHAFKCNYTKENKYKLSLRILFLGMKQSTSDYFVVKNMTPRNDVGNINR